MTMNNAAPCGNRWSGFILLLMPPGCTLLIQAAEAEIMDTIGYICLLALFIGLSAGALIALCACMLSSQISRELDE